MMQRRGAFKPRIIDRIVFGIVAVLHLANGVYLVGPWYLPNWSGDGKAPLNLVFNSESIVQVYGLVLFINGLALLYISAEKSTRRFYTAITSTTLLSGFLLRLYSLIGVVMVLDSWRPPSYLSHVATVVLLGAYWIWVKVSVRTIQ